MEREEVYSLIESMLSKGKEREGRAGGGEEGRGREGKMLFYLSHLEYIHLFPYRLLVW